MAIKATGNAPADFAEKMAGAQTNEKSPALPGEQAAETLALPEAWGQPAREDRYEGPSVDIESMAYTQPGQKNRFAGAGTSKPKDSAPGLTARLVSASSEMQVGAVISEAHSAMMGLRMAAALGKGEDAEKARAYLRKLEKLVGRARGKITQLKKEDAVRSRQKKAEQKNLQKRAEKLKLELRKKTTARAARENAWLLDARGTDLAAANPNRPGPAAGHRARQDKVDLRREPLTETELARLAEALAAREAADAEAPGADAAAADTGLPDAAAPPAEGGAPAAEAGAEPEGGGVDIVV